MPVTLICGNCGRDFTVRTADRKQKFCSRDCGNRSRRSPGLFSPDELWARLEERSMPIPFSGCQVWLGAVMSNGYGNMYLGGGESNPRYEAAHRVAYRLTHGPIPPDRELDHDCRVRICLNPDHLTPVTHLENMARMVISASGRKRLRTASSMSLAIRRTKNAERSQCLHGHALTPENTHVLQSGMRVCRACRAATQSRYRASHQAKDTTP